MGAFTGRICRLHCGKRLCCDVTSAAYDVQPSAVTKTEVHGIGKEAASAAALPQAPTMSRGFFRKLNHLTPSHDAKRTYAHIHQLPRPHTQRQTMTHSTTTAAKSIEILCGLFREKKYPVVTTNRKSFFLFTVTKLCVASEDGRMCDRHSLHRHSRFYV